MRIALAVLLMACVSQSAQVGSDLASDDPLFVGLSEQPWLDSPNMSEQYFPLFLGARPRELAYGGKKAATAELWQSLRALGESQALKIAQTLDRRSVQLQVWPTEDWNGQYNWVFARWRERDDASWEWLTQRNWKKAWGEEVGQKPLLPTTLDADEDEADLFGDFLDYDDLYQQPMAGNCVFTKGPNAVVAWPHPDKRGELRDALGGTRAYCMNPPARFNGAPFAVTLVIEEGQVRWPKTITWTAMPTQTPEGIDSPVQVTEWPSDFDRAYEDDLYVADGEMEAVFPLSKRRARFVKKGSFQPDHDLEAMVDWLEERYAELGVETKRQQFYWRGILQSNLIAVLPGSEGGAPVIMADHIDGAVEEDTFEKTQARVTTKGADDNTTATAALLGAARALQGVPHKRDIWLVHLTGEEYPSVDLGARYFLSEMMRKKQDFHAVVIMDFIGWHEPGKTAYQISPTDVPGSEHIAAVALDAARKVAPELEAVYQPRNNERNAVFQTDLQEFEFRGFPGILFNEHMNYASGAGTNPNYHQSTDVGANINFPFATSVARVAIESAVRLANE